MPVVAFHGGRPFGEQGRVKNAALCEARSVRNLAFFSVLERGEIDALDAIADQVNYSPRQSIFCEGETAEYVFNVTGGDARIYKLLADGRLQGTGFLFAGDFIGLSALETYAYSAEAITQLSAYRFPRKKLEGMLEQYPKLEKHLLGMVVNELTTAQDQMLLLGRKTAQERVASFLLILSHRLNGRGRDADSISLPMTRADIADYLGLTIETVSRAFTRLRRADVIAKGSDGAIQLIDRQALEDLGG